jgi:formylmethanofuran dehydrogenase subunit E
VLKPKPLNMTPEESRGYYFDRSCEELFDAQPTRIPLPTPARIFDSYYCECCGEKTGANWIRIVGGKKLCLDCCEPYNRFDV